MNKRAFLIVPLSILIFTASSGKAAHKERPVNPQQLKEIIDAADRLIVKESLFGKAEVLFESTDRTDMKALKNSLGIEKQNEWFHDMCQGGPALYLYKGGEELGILTNHHGFSVRFSLWDSDARVIDTETRLSWFDDRGISGPRKEVELIRAQREKSERDRVQWLSAMPEPIKPLWSGASGQFGDVNVEPLSQALRAGMPEQSRRILALLEWFGSGAGPWSGFPSYESAVEELLLEYETEEIVAAISNRELTGAQMEGAARLFGGWRFSKKRPDELRMVPDSLKETFWNHVKSTRDRDKRGRAERAFRN